MSDKIIAIDLFGSILKFKDEFYKYLSNKLYTDKDILIQNSSLANMFKDKHYHDVLKELELVSKNSITPKYLSRAVISNTNNDGYNFGQLFFKRRDINYILSQLSQKGFKIVIISNTDLKTCSQLVKSFNLKKDNAEVICTDYNTPAYKALENNGYNLSQCLLITQSRCFYETSKLHNLNVYKLGNNINKEEVLNIFVQYFHNPKNNKSTKEELLAS